MIPPHRHLYRFKNWFFIFYFSTNFVSGKLLRSRWLWPWSFPRLKKKFKINNFFWSNHKNLVFVSESFFSNELVLSTFSIKRKTVTKIKKNLSRKLFCSLGHFIPSNKMYQVERKRDAKKNTFFKKVKKKKIILKDSCLANIKTCV